MTITLDAWVIVIPDDRVLVGTLRRDRDQVLTDDCAAVCVLNHVRAEEVRIVPVQLVVDLDAAVVYAEDPAYAAVREAVELAQRKTDPEARR